MACKVVAQPNARLYECQVEGSDAQNFSCAQIQCWISKQQSDVRGVLCLIQHPPRLSCWFPSQLVASIWEKSSVPINESGLSFCSKVSPPQEVASPEILDFGKIILPTFGTIHPHLTFEVQRQSGVVTDKNIDVAVDSKKVHCIVESISEGHWKFNCELYPEAFPCGGFHMTVPLRFRREGERILGGLSVTMQGAIIGEFSVQPGARMAMKLEIKITLSSV